TQIESLVQARILHITKEDFLPAFFEAFKNSMTKSNVQAGFKGAGLVPFNPEIVISKLDVKLQTPTSSQPPIQETLPWASRTPNNPTKATSQSEFIKSRIARHQNSSPTSIYNAIDQFAKGARGIMHRMALLQAEVTELREANSIISKRRRAKKTRVQLGEEALIPTPKATFKATSKATTITTTNPRAILIATTSISSPSIASILYTFSLVVSPILPILPIVSLSPI
ncbi:hypothetical protein V502_01420, partial [Pseudogymnoascus sp. VKM F-4520 (FW-2644)]